MPFAFANLEMEPQYIFAVSQAFGLPHTHVVAGAHLDQDELLDRSLKVLGYPVEHDSATHHEPFYRLAETFNIRTLLSGFGGDEFGTTHSRVYGPHGNDAPTSIQGAPEYPAPGTLSFAFCDW